MGDELKLKLTLGETRFCAFVPMYVNGKHQGDYELDITDQVKSLIGGIEVLTKQENIMKEENN